MNNISCKEIAKYISQSSDFLELAKHIRKNELKGYDSSSESPTDIFEVRLDNGKRLIFKIFPHKINNTLAIKDEKGTNIHFSINTQQLLYEQLVYSLKIKPLLYNNICPFFIDTYKLHFDIDYETLLKFMTFIIKEDHMTPEKIRLNLNRNIFYMLFVYQNANSQIYIKNKYFSENKRFSLTTERTNITQRYIKYDETTNKESIYHITDKVLLSNDSNEFLKSVKFGTIITEMINNTVHSELTYLENKKLSGEITINQFMNSLKEITIQCLIACYTMYLSGLIHNDLHTDNIRIVKADEKEKFSYLYKINGKKYYFESNYCIKVFDYDRSYMKGMDNDYLDGGLEKFSQANVLVNKKDFVKVCCYFNKHYNNNFTRQERKLIKRYYTYLLLNKENMELTDYVYDDDCYLVDKDLGAPSNSEQNFELFSSYEDMIDKALKEYEITDSKYELLLENKNITPYYLDEKYFRDYNFDSVAFHSFS